MPCHPQTLFPEKHSLPIPSCICFCFLLVLVNFTFETIMKMFIFNVVFDVTVTSNFIINCLVLFKPYFFSFTMVLLTIAFLTLKIVLLSSTIFFLLPYLADLTLRSWSNFFLHWLPTLNLFFFPFAMILLTITCPYWNYLLKQYWRHSSSISILKQLVLTISSSMTFYLLPCLVVAGHCPWNNFFLYWLPILHLFIASFAIVLITITCPIKITLILVNLMFYCWSKHSSSTLFLKQLVLPISSSISSLWYTFASSIYPTMAFCECLPSSVCSLGNNIEEVPRPTSVLAELWLPNILVHCLALLNSFLLSFCNGSINHNLSPLSRFFWILCFTFQAILKIFILDIRFEATCLDNFFFYPFLSSSVPCRCRTSILEQFLVVLATFSSSSFEAILKAIISDITLEAIFFAIGFLCWFFLLRVTFRFCEWLPSSILCRWSSIEEGHPLTHFFTQFPLPSSSSTASPCSNFVLLFFRTRPINDCPFTLKISLFFWELFPSSTFYSRQSPSILFLGRTSSSIGPLLFFSSSPLSYFFCCKCGFYDTPAKKKYWKYSPSTSFFFSPIYSSIVVFCLKLSNLSRSHRLSVNSQFTIVLYSFS